MNNYLSRAEIEEVGEGLIATYAKKYPNRATEHVDIEHFVTDFLNLSIDYASFAERDLGRIGFLADGVTPLHILHDKKVEQKVFPKGTIVLEKELLYEKERGKRRFTLAHEAAHYILGKMSSEEQEAQFHNEYNNAKTYTRNELVQLFSANEWQADTMGAILIMPRKVIENALAKYNGSKPVKIYGDNTVPVREKNIIKTIANELGVSFTALFIRLRELKLFDYHDISEYICGELNLGGVSG